MFTGRFFTTHIEECAVRRWIVLILVIASLFVPTCEQGEVGEFGAEADYLNDCRPYDLILEELLGTLSSEKIEELLSETDELGMTVPVDEELPSVEASARSASGSSSIRTAPPATGSRSPRSFCRSFWSRSAKSLDAPHVFV
jgi:hypothetical protein